MVLLSVFDNLSIFEKKQKKMISLYFDPGTGALIVQFLAAGVAAAALFYKTVIAKVKSVFGVKSKEEDDFMEDADTTEDDK